MSKARDLLNTLNEADDWNIHKKELKKAGFDLHPNHHANVNINRNNYPQNRDIYTGKMSNGHTMVITQLTPIDMDRYASVKDASGKFIKHYYVAPVKPTLSKSPVLKSTAIGNDPKTVLEEIKAAMRMVPEGRQATFRSVEQNGKYYEFDVRYWGSWEVPDGEDDDGDYDFEVLTSKSSKSLQNIVEPIIKKYPSLDIYYQTGEKNYITVHATVK
ncbi:hypothetical protein EVB32_289 [Rhizobium phage RHph_TM39]|uniref:Uncharacterized protein n=1 Tax=Rhizobium phage RHph_TM30 TaxID=2509764 RepID=A0A7S5R5E1_9CAUD|nr:hypothetical protein PQC16_gp351 [Rhizobium phage RHph_TM30]QIG71761.1 hypothetical protein EVB94_308 [Rhizobium phage RHph_TM40]QIG72122.1 hypothetical protein EVB95_306 [Rhizobium phage RHph_TM2_3B]QIG72484.1 hypothetical protein EVB96_306 [Rhizobium phage RHph_TM3_3_6]QIG77259.1 hypothetical protein EVB32_289 [Rhizobium phage RHph_TM39]QIG77552.1 hypothetical protein EVB61_244 [Rhizobium phage RHph_TM21B]QIG77874.1 hypothetical protein EVB64_306 [Rhizobium phage RHph_TM61]